MTQLHQQIGTTPHGYEGKPLYVTLFWFISPMQPFSKKLIPCWLSLWSANVFGEPSRHCLGQHHDGATNQHSLHGEVQHLQLTHMCVSLSTYTQTPKGCPTRHNTSTPNAEPLPSIRTSGRAQHSLDSWPTPPAVCTPASAACCSGPCINGY